MRSKVNRLIIAIVLFIMCARSYGQQLYSQTTIDINRLPINIFFIREDKELVGFIIAGHAYKDICRLASLEVKNFLDSMSDKSKSFFSFGVGFDLRKEDKVGNYSQRLNELRRSFESLEALDPTQVRVGQITKSSFELRLKKFKENFTEAKHSMELNPNVNRVVLKYNISDASLPVPFYINDTIITFRIKKKDFGVIPSYTQFENDLLEKALKDTRQAITENNIAIDRLELYDPVKVQRDIVNDTFKVVYNTGLKKATLAALSQFDTTKWVKSFDPVTKQTTKFYSLTELRRKCNSGETTMSLGAGSYKKEFNTCSMVRSAIAEIKTLKEQKQELIDLLLYQNRSLNVYLQKLLSFKTVVSGKARGKDYSLEIDGFLRGWYFNAGNKTVNAELDKWYLRRPVIWNQILSANAEFSKLITGHQMIQQQFIAGIFQSDDVFFSVKDDGMFFNITPYKMLSGEIIQVIDRQNSVCHFFTANNYRLLKL